MQDDLADMFQSTGSLAFDLAVSDNENLAIAGHKVQKVRSRATHARTHRCTRVALAQY